MEVDPEEFFLENVCLPFLLAAQNADGGWGFHLKAESRAEPTSWAVQALAGCLTPATEAAPARGFEYLRAAQLGDGSWPATGDQESGCWVTSLSCWAMQSNPEPGAAVGAGLRWICRDWPRDTTPWRRFLARFSSQNELHPVNNSYRGWSWTPGTSSWVEPTSFALIALERPADGLPASEVKRRRELGVALLYDRMCPGGGWNCGNPRVYGVPGDPLVGPTVWALMALRHQPARPENVLSLEWLERDMVHIQSPGSLALAKICMETYRRKWPANAPVLSELHERNGSLESIQVAAWTCLALSARRGWLTPAVGKTA